VQGSSAFGKDLPPFVVAAERNYIFGLNILGMRRAGLSANDRNEIKEAFKLVYLSGLNTSQALEKAETMILWRTSPRIPGLRCQCKKAGDLPVETRYGPRRFGLTTNRIPRLHSQPPWTGGMIAISSPGFSL
jgi:Acyl-[acyl carrier protein]--UDP-N-acetylglucosamine O-acyltransferase